ncbi:MAG: hypothetical protein J7L88_01470 [Thermoplasmata archaeon]|nr:hypothetical protein [Thermoplasmata archaeon]
MRGRPYLILLVVAIVTLSGLYLLYPRREAVVYLLYHESVGGGGTGGIINVNLMIKNTGNRKLDYAEGSVVVSTAGSEVARFNISAWGVDPGGLYEERNHFVGDQFLPYTIEINLIYAIGGKGGEVHRTYHVDSRYMNVLESFKLSP